jgi:hypothetical protein
VNRARYRRTTWWRSSKVVDDKWAAKVRSDFPVHTKRKGPAVTIGHYRFRLSIYFRRLLIAVLQHQCSVVLIAGRRRRNNDAPAFICLFLVLLLRLLSWFPSLRCCHWSTCQYL